MTIKQAILTAVCLGSFSAVGVLAGDYHSTSADVQDPAMEDENLQAETRGEVRTNADLNNDGIIDESEATTEVPASFQGDDSAEAWDDDEESSYDDSSVDMEDSSEVNP